MSIQVLARRAVALLLVCAMVCIAVGAVKIQTERQYPPNASVPASSPAAVGTAAFHNSVTSSVQQPFKTHSWLSPILWADSQTLFYRGKADIDIGERHPLYQLPVYPLPWSLYYCKTTNHEQELNFNDDRLNRIDPYTASDVLQGLFVRAMPIYARYDTQMMNPQGGYTNDPKYNIYALYGTYTAPAINLDPGFDAKNIRINRIGDYDAGFVLASSDDPDRQASIPADAKLSLDVVRGSPFLHLTAEKIPMLNLTTWSAQGVPSIKGTVQAGSRTISYVQYTKPMRSYGVTPVTASQPEVSEQNQTYIIFYPSDSAQYAETDLDPLPVSNGLVWYRTAGAFTFSNQAGPNYLTMTSVPSPDLVDSTLLQILAEAAFRYPAGSSVQYGYDPAKAEVTATYTLTTNDVLNLGGTPVQGLLPLHYGKFFGDNSVLTSAADWVKNGSGTPMTMDSIQGEIHFLKGSTFACTYRYPGVLPYIPALPSQDKEGITNLTKYLKIWESLYTQGGWAAYKYTGMNLGLGLDTYNAVQVLWRAANTYRTAQGVDTAISKDASESAGRSLSLFFAENPAVITEVNTGHAPYYSYYDPNASSILLYPGGVGPNWPPNDERYVQWDGYGTVTKLNDHHYTYGYFIGAAAEVALDDPAWMEQHKGVINQLVFDVAYDPAMQSKAQFAFPKMQNWDPYTGHCEAGGMTYPYYDGNSDESISEEMQFWYSVIMWGSASGQADIETLGITHYTQAVYAYFTFWHDSFGNYQKLWNTVKGSGFDPVWVSKDYCPQIWDSKMKQTTFFGSGPVARTAITVLPMTGGSFYHAMNKTMIESYSSKYLEFISKGKWDMDPLNPNGQHWNQPYNGNEKTGNPWSGEIAYNSELACWYALINPDKAASTFLPYLDPDTANNPSEFGTTPINLFSRTEKGVPETYHFIRFLQDYGTPDPLPVYATNTPYSMTFVKNGVRTYVGYNPTNAPLDIAFSDSRIIKSVQPKQFGIWPSGLPGPVNASFRADPVSGFLPLQVNFTDSSQGQIVAWAWTFGDGGSSTAQNPSHTFTTEGTFNVTLIITDSTQKTSSYSQTITVSLGQASFTASPMGGIAPLLVKFTDTSGGVITSWAWTFGDGGSSTEQNPTHTFTTDGAFNVTLSVTDSTQRTSSCSETIIVKKSGELPGNFSISTLDSGSGTIGLYPSIATNGANQTYIAYFSSSASPPWADGTGGSVGVITLDTGTTPVTIQKEKNVAALTYHVLPPQVIQPEWGRSVITLDAGQKPVVAYINSGDTNPYYPQKLVLAYKSDDGWGQSKVADAFPWYPSVTGQGGEFPTAGFISGTGKNVNYLFNNDKDYKKPWGNVYVTPSGDQRTFFSDLAFLTHLYNGTEKTPSMVYYNQTSQDILDSWLPNKQAVATWNTERIWSGVNAGWLSAASDPGTGILGICWYDLTDKTLKFTQRQSGGSWSTPELVDTSGHDVGSNCSLAYGPASGIVPGPGISYYDATTRSLRFAWKDTSGWHTTEVDTGGAGTSSSLAYSSNGYPRIAYRHEDENALKVAYLKEGTGISADFTSDLRNGPVPLTVRFSDTSLSGVSGMSIAGTGNPDSSYGFHYWWDFDGDGDWEAEDDPNPVYTYAEAGSYSVRMLIHIKIFLLFFDLDVWGIADKGDYINATGPSAANFTASPLSGTPPLTVNFTDTSIGNYSAWNWTFGDGTGSSEQNPVHTYEGIGKYSVTLEVDGKGGSEITRKPGYIDVNSGALSGQAGILKISSDPDGAAIILDGVFQKTTPVDSLIARAGYHRLTLQKQGYQDSNQVISVSAGNLTVIPRVKLREIPA